jgi:tagatose-1,6-bisphosphate aldolase
VKTLTSGKIRGLTQASTDAGVFAIFAIDHRDSMRIIIDPERPAGISAEQMTETKLEFVRAMAPSATAVLLDPEYSAIQAVDSRALTGDTALLCALEAQGYLGDPHSRETTLLDGWSVGKAKRLGASGVKLLLLYRPGSTVAAKQEALVSEVVAACATHDIPLFLEPVSYELGTAETPGTAQFGSDRRTIVCESARRLGALGPDILKVQFPADTTGVIDRSEWKDACVELDEASPVPWTLLSGGDPIDSFVEQVAIACDAGASGFLVGRALWADAVRASGAHRQALIDSFVRPRFAELADIATSAGTDWGARYNLEDRGPVNDRAGTPSL